MWRLRPCRFSERKSDRTRISILADWKRAEESRDVTPELSPQTIQISQIDDCHATVYSDEVIKTFADKATYELYHTGRSRQFPPNIRKRALRRLEYLDLAATLEDLRVPPSNRLHQLSRDRSGQYSISVNDQWRICFRFVDGDVYDVELTDYH
jgi:toxin HigB-1